MVPPPLFDLIFSLSLFCQPYPELMGHFIHHARYNFPSRAFVLPWWLRGWRIPCNLGDLGSIPGVGRSPGEAHGNPLQYSCLENPHGQRSLAGCSPWAHKEPDVTEQLGTEHRAFVLAANSCWILFFPQMTTCVTFSPCLGFCSNMTKAFFKLLISNWHSHCLLYFYPKNFSPSNILFIFLLIFIYLFITFIGG